MFRLTKTLFLMLLMSMLFMSSQIFAKHVLPVFAGFWYTKVKFNYMDSCLQNKYNYDVKLYGDAKTVASTLLKDVPLHSDCQWNDPILERELSSKPDDFVSLEEQEDWDVILQEHLGPQPQSWYRVCLNNEGYQKDRVSVVIQPSYECPKGSRYARRDWDSFLDFGICSTKPILCDADIVGRNLRSSEINDPLGHVALTQGTNLPATPDTVLEVLHADPVIQKNTFASFYTPVSQYWGIKYGLSSTVELKDRQAFYVLDAGQDQKDCDEVAYTFDWDWYPCQYDPTRGKRTAVFRCDSFVYNSYLQGADIKIMPYGPPVVPLDMFNQFLNFRYDWVKPTGSQHLPNNLERYLKLILKPSILQQEQNIQEIFSSKPFDLRAADVATHYFVVEDLLVPRDEKIKFLWNLVLHYHNDEMRFNYLMGCLGFLKPIEIVVDMINEYQSQASLENKNVIMRILSDATTDDALTYYESLGELFDNIATKNIVMIKQFFSNILLHEINLAILEKAIFYYGHIFEPEIAKVAIDATLQRVDIDSKQLKQQMFTRVPFYTHQLTMIFSSSAMQKEYLSVLLHDVENMNTVTQFNQSLFYYFSDADFYPPKVGYDSSKIEESIRPLLLLYLNRHKPPAFKSNHFPNHFSDKEIYDWLVTNFAIQAHSNLERNKMMVQYIRDTQNLAYKAMLLFNATNAIYEQFSASELNDMISIFNLKINKPNVTSRNSNYEDLFIKMALGKLHSILHTKMR